MRVLVWIAHDTWKATVAAAATLLPTDAEITLLHVMPTDAETVARSARHGLLGRHDPTDHQTLHMLSEESARNLLAEARSLLGRQATLEARHGRPEREIVAAAERSDLLVLARDGDHAHRGPRSVAPAARFVVDHAPCTVLLVRPNSRAE